MPDKYGQETYEELKDWIDRRRALGIPTLQGPTDELARSIKTVDDLMTTQDDIAAGAIVGRQRITADEEQMLWHIAIGALQTIAYMGGRDQEARVAQTDRGFAVDYAGPLAAVYDELAEKMQEFC